MIPILYESTETSFLSFGLGTLSDVKTCVVKEERNGAYELLMTYPVTGKHFKDLAMRRIILAKPNYNDDPQPFRIYNISKPMNGITEISAEHISYELAGYPVNPFTASNLAGAMSGLISNCMTACGYTITADHTSIGDFKVDVPSSIRSWFGGKEGSILDVYGGEWHYDKFTCTNMESRGQDTGYTIRYGKNLIDLKQDENCSNVYTGVVGYWANSEGTIVKTGIITIGSANFTRIMMLDLTAEYEEAPTVEMLTTRVERYIRNNNLGTPDINLTVDFLQLEEGAWQTACNSPSLSTESKVINLCDTATIYFEELGVNATAKCIKTEYDVIQERYNKITLGNAKSTFADTIVSTQKALEPTAMLKKVTTAIERATDLITGNLGGYVVINDANNDGYPDEILIMNTADITTATKVWRWNKNGLGYSSTGYNGTYTTAITADGAIVADFISTGLLSDGVGNNSWNLNTGVLSLDASTTLDGTNLDTRIGLTETGLTSKVSKDSVISEINQSAEAITISAEKLELDGKITISSLASSLKSNILKSVTTKAQYYLSSSNTELLNGSWSDSVPSWVVNKYIWTRIATTKTFEDDSTATTYSTEVYDSNLTDAIYTANAASSGLSSYITTNDAAIASLQNQVDGQIEAWYYSVDPTTSNAPASSWTTSELKTRHEGDLYYNVTNGHSWRWLYDSDAGTWKWLQIPDSDAAAALAAAQAAQTTAGTKRRVFTDTPTVPYDEGDLWVSGTSVKYATNSRTSSQSYTESDWSVTATDDTTATSALTKANGAVGESLPVYYRSSINTTPTLTSSTTIGTTTDTDDVWTYCVPKPKHGCYFYQAERYVYRDNTVGVSTVRSMDSLTASSEWCKSNDSTYIDGAKLYTGTVTADSIRASDLYALGATIGGFDIGSTNIKTHNVAITSNADDSVGLSSSTFTRTIGGTSRSNLKFALGSKFGVKNDGTVYASGGSFSGSVSATAFSTTGVVGRGIYHSGTYEVTYFDHIVNVNLEGASGTEITGASSSDSYLLGSIPPRQVIYAPAIISISDKYYLGVVQISTSGRITIWYYPTYGGTTATSISGVQNISSQVSQIFANITYFTND